jgi:hypothetical protein
MVVGVDNGLSGAWCVLQPDGSVVEYGIMPLTKFGGKSEIDPEALLATFRRFEGASVAVEEPLRFAPTLQAMRSMSISFGKILGLCAAAEIPLQRVQVRDWQNAKLGKFAKGKSKVAALKAAKKIWPGEKFKVGKMSGPHDGIVDAALIGLYALGL